MARSRPASQPTAPALSSDILRAALSEANDVPPREKERRRSKALHSSVSFGFEANPPFNDSDGFRQGDDVRWHGAAAEMERPQVDPQGAAMPRRQFGVPPKGNANFAWVQHFIHHLASGGPGNAGGMAGFVLANGSTCTFGAGVGSYNASTS